MQIEYRIQLKTEYCYGYLSFRSEKKSDYQKIFPEGEFTVDFEGHLLQNRKVDWKRHRINLYPLRKMINKGDCLIIERKGDMIKIHKNKQDEYYNANFAISGARSL